MKKIYSYVIVLISIIFLFSCENSTKSKKEFDTIIDIDGNEYEVIKIGEQYWMAENLRVTRYKNGVEIPKVTNNNIWYNLSSGAYSIYENDSSYANIYGYLYNWYAVNNENNIAPEGWHVPTNEDWEELANYISDSNGGYSMYNQYSWNNIGKHLKSNFGWKYGSVGTDDYGFTSLPAGYLEEQGYYGALGFVTYFWSSDESTTDNSWFRSVNFHDDIFECYWRDKNWGFSVRCIKDKE